MSLFGLGRRTLRAFLRRSPREQLADSFPGERGARGAPRFGARFFSLPHSTPRSGLRAPSREKSLPACTTGRPSNNLYLPYKPQTSATATKQHVAEDLPVLLPADVTRWNREAVQGINFRSMDSQILLKVVVKTQSYNVSDKSSPIGERLLIYYLKQGNKDHKNKETMYWMLLDESALNTSSVQKVLRAVEAEREQAASAVLQRTAHFHSRDKPQTAIYLGCTLLGEPGAQRSLSLPRKLRFTSNGIIYD